MTLDACPICACAICETDTCPSCGASIAWLERAPEMLRAKLGHAGLAMVGVLITATMAGCTSCVGQLPPDTGTTAADAGADR